MKGQKLLQARKKNGWSQLEVAARLDVSQPYLSLLEKEARPVTKKLARKAVKVFKLPITHLPLTVDWGKIRFVSDKALAADLAALGYPGLAHLRSSAPKNPQHVLLTALAADDLDSRLIEALPWIILKFTEMDWATIIRVAKINDLQNRLGFVANVARRLADKTGADRKARQIETLEEKLERSRLAREDTLCHRSLTEAEKRWLRLNRSEAAEHWNLLTDLSPEHLSYDL